MKVVRNSMRIDLIALCLFVSCGSALATPQGGDSSPPEKLQIPASFFEKAVACIKEFEGWHSAKHYPYIGYGHNYPNLDIILTLHCK